MNVFFVTVSRVVFVVLMLLSGVKVKAAVPATYHDITFYVMPTMHPLDWSSPASLYKTMKSCYVKTIGVSDVYLLGHMAVKLETPLLEKPMLIGQASGPTHEKTQLIFKEKIGYGILGAALAGRIETDAELLHKLKVYAQRGKLAFIKYRVNAEAMVRVLAFIEKYTQKFNTRNAACDFYGGAFWPRYQFEGGSCTSFGFSLLDVINLLPPADYNWRVDLKIPKKLIGGSFNNHKKVKFTTIKKTDEWFTGKGQLNVDYVKYSVYEPSIIFNWILSYPKQNGSEFSVVSNAEVPGLFVDKSNTTFNADAPLFIERSEPNLFVDVYLEKNINKKH